MRYLGLLIAVCLSLLANIVSASNTVCLIAADGNNLLSLRLKGTSLVTSATMLSKDWGYTVFPGYNSVIQKLIFESRYKDKESYIYTLDLPIKNSKPKEFIRGSYPSIHQDGRKIAYFNSNEILILKDILNSEDDGIEINSARFGFPVVWVTQSSFLYVTKMNQVFIYDVSEGKQNEALQIGKVFPVSSNNNVVLFMSWDGKKIFKAYFSQSNLEQVELVVDNKFFDVGRMALLFQNNNFFLYTRKTLSSLFPPSELKSLFKKLIYDDVETELKKDFSFFGGVWLPCQSE